MKTPTELIAELPSLGGAIVTSGVCSELEIADAQATGRFVVDADGIGYVRRYKEWVERAMALSREVVDNRVTAEASPICASCGHPVRRLCGILLHLPADAGAVFDHAATESLGMPDYRVQRVEAAGISCPVCGDPATPGQSPCKNCGSSLDWS